VPEHALQDFNQRIIDDFRANAGKVGAPFEGRPMILVHHRGARSSTERVTPLVYQPVGDNFAVFASWGGSPSHPQWFGNVVAHPRTTVEVGTDTIEVEARVLTGSEREAVWAKQKELMPVFGEYEEKTKGIREIPVVLFERAG
jgi:deazaflavin-dependent oxidoreductase (nitroreductase family)